MIHHPLINDRASWRKEIEGNVPSTHVAVLRAIDLHQWRSVTVLDGQQIVKQPARQTHNALVYGLHADARKIFEADFYRGQIEVVERPIFKGFSTFEHHMSISLHRDAPDRASRKP